MIRTKRVMAVVVAVAAVGLLAGCSDDEEGRGDAPVGTRYERPREIIVMPDQFGNIAFACDGHGHRVYTNTHDKLYVVKDASCEARSSAGRPDDDRSNP